MDFPLFIKPNEESQGRGVSRVYDLRQLVDELHVLFSSEDKVLVQKPVAGKDFRVVVLGKAVISAYQRSPLQIQSDGVQTIYMLVEDKISQLRKTGRGKNIESADHRIARELAHQGYRLGDIPPPRVTITLLPNANLSTGGSSEDLTNEIHPSYREYCIKLAHDCGLSFCGVDIIAESITEPLTSAPTVLEINSAPGLNNFATSGTDQAQVVEALYENLLLHLQDRSL